MRAVTVAAAVALVAAACGTGSPAATAGTETPPTTAAPSPTSTTTPSTTTTTTTTTTGATGEAAAEVGTRDTDLGTILVDPDGMTLYVFMPDEQGKPTCYDTCADNWPPLVADVTAGDGVDASLLGTVARKAGFYQTPEMQVTYDGWPLYRFAGDHAPGDTNGQGVKGVWYVIDPSGRPIR